MIAAIHRPGRSFGNDDRHFAFALGAGGALDRFGEALGKRAGNLEPRFILRDANGADFVARDVAAAAQQRQEPARIGIVAPADVHLEPDDVVEAGAMAVGLGRQAVRANVDQFLGFGQARAVNFDQSRGNVLGALLGDVRRGDEDHLGEVEFDVEVVVAERVVLGRVEHLEQGRGGVAAPVGADLVHLVQHDHRVHRAGVSQRPHQPPRHPSPANAARSGSR